jgi:hypothetical protein
MSTGNRYSRVEAMISQEPGLPQDSPGVVGGMRRLCGAASRALSAAGCGLTVMAGEGQRGVTAASDEASGRLEELQFTFGEGPCIDAFESQRPVLIADLDNATMNRWPAYAPAVRDQGVRAVFAFPLQIGAAQLGILDVFRARPGMLTADELALALTFAEVAVATLIDGLGSGRQGARADWLRDPLGPRAELFQAQGMVMVQLEVTLVEAMARMRAHAFAHDLRLSDVAALIVARELTFDQ